MLTFLKKIFGGSVDPLKPRIVGDGETDVESLKAFVEFIAAKLVDYPDKVEVICNEDERMLSLKISCEKSDVGKIVGKNGKTIAAIRSLVSGAGGRLGRKAVVEVLD